MLRIYSSTHIQPLSSRLAEVLSTPMEDVMTPEWIAVPSAGMERWLRLDLSARLGVGTLGSDGIAANIEFAFPGSLRSRVLMGTDQTDPWRLEHLVWSVLHVLTTSTAPELAAVSQLPAGASWFSRARRIADLFDRYSYHRPRMLTDWLGGKWSDGSGGEVPAHMRWQPVLWRLLREHIGSASPPEQITGRLSQIKADPTVVDLPSRIAIFGVSTLPGGPQFLELLDAVGTHRDVGLYLCDPSVAAADSISALVASDPLVGGMRVDDRSDVAIVNPLLRSWGRPTREAQVQLAHAVQSGLAPVERLRLDPTEPSSLLSRLQADIVINAAPDGKYVSAGDDNSFQLHACHGATRQVEVVKEVILGLLADDPTLTEEDIVIVAPDLVQFAPLVSAVFGAPAGLNSLTQVDQEQPPTLRYRISDRSLRNSYPLLNTTALVFELISGRFGASDVLDFCSLSPVRHKFGFSDDDLAEIGRWVDGANIRWGLNGEHRSRWGMPPEFEANSWRSGLDQLLMGVAVHDDEPSFGPGDVPPYGVEGSAVVVLGRFAELINVLSSLAETAALARPVADWCALTADRMAQLCDVPWSEQWQQQRLAKVLDKIGGDARVERQVTSISLGDFRRVLSEYLTPSAGRAGFFEGGITVTSLQPMRWITHRVVFLLGADQSVFGTSGVDGDDLVALTPRVGDPDPRGESRQAMLETLMSASDHFVVTRTGRDLRANADVPKAVPVLELLEAAQATLHPDHRGLLKLESVHPRQANDEVNFMVDPSRAAQGRPFSFDPRGLNAAKARQQRLVEAQPFLAEPLPPRPLETVNLEQLHKFFKNPARYFFQERLNLVMTRAGESKPDHLPVELDALEKWQLGMDLIATGISKANADRFIRIQQARGVLPPGHLGDAQARELKELVNDMFAVIIARGVKLQDDRFDVHTVVDGVPVGGQVVSWSDGPHPGPLSLTYSNADGRHKLSLWLDLLSMTATDPSKDWRALGVARENQKATTTSFLVKGETGPERQDTALRVLNLLVDLLRRGDSEPLPLFAKTSFTLAYEKKSIGSIWDSSKFPERDDAYYFEVFGHLDSISLLELPLRGDEPFGNGDDRVSRFAYVLWDAFKNSTVDVSELPNNRLAVV